MYAQRTSLGQRLLGAIDLALDFATLGEYGLERVEADGPRRERSGCKTGWEALARPTAMRARAECRLARLAAVDRGDQLAA